MLRVPEDLDVLEIAEIRAHLLRASMGEVLVFARKVGLPRVKIKNRTTRSEFIDDICSFIEDTAQCLPSQPEPSCVEPVPGVQTSTVVDMIIANIDVGEYDEYLKEIARAVWARKQVLDALVGKTE
jgi:hypothetical protein